MTDQFRETKATSWGARIQQAFAAVLIGFLLFVGSFSLLWWNEGRSHDRILALQEGLAAVVPVQASPLDPAHEGHLIHFSALAGTAEILTDPDFLVHGNVLALRRTVSMYQWEESQEEKTTKNMGGSETTETVYTYAKKWSETPIESASFRIAEGHQNPTFPFEGQVMTAQNVKAGDYHLGQDFLAQLTMFEPYSLQQADFDALNESMKSSFKMQGAQFIKGDPAHPQIGDLRVSFDIVRPQDISVIGRQSGDRVDSFLTTHGTIALLEAGNVNAEMMFAHEQDANNMMTWLIRAGGFIMMWVGLAMIFNPLAVLGDVVPVIGSLLGAGIGLAAGVLSLTLSVLTIAVSWLFFRPLIGAALLVTGVAILLAGSKIAKNKVKTTA